MWTLSHCMAHRSSGPETTRTSTTSPRVEDEAPPAGPATVGRGLAGGQAPQPDLVQVAHHHGRHPDRGDLPQGRQASSAHPSTPVRGSGRPPGRSRRGSVRGAVLDRHRDRPGVPPRRPADRPRPHGEARARRHERRRSPSPRRPRPAAPEAPGAVWTHGLPGPATCATRRAAARAHEHRRPGPASRPRRPWPGRPNRWVPGRHPTGTTGRAAPAPRRPRPTPRPGSAPRPARPAPPGSDSSRSTEVRPPWPRRPSTGPTLVHAPGRPVDDGVNSPSTVAVRAGPSDHRGAGRVVGHRGDAPAAGSPTGRRRHRRRRGQGPPGVEVARRGDEGLPRAAGPRRPASRTGPRPGRRGRPTGRWAVDPATTWHRRRWTGPAGRTSGRPM